MNISNDKSANSAADNDIIHKDLKEKPLNLLPLSDFDFDKLMRDKNYWFEISVDALASGTMNFKFAESLLGFSRPNVHAPTMPPQRDENLPKADWMRLTAGQRWHNCTKHQPRITARQVRETRVNAASTPMRKAASGGFRTEDLCAFGNLEYFKPLVKPMWLSAPIGGGAIARAVNDLMPKIQELFDKELQVMTRQVQASLGWRLFVKALGTREEIERSRFFLEQKKIADPVIDEMRNELRHICAGTGDELGVIDDQIKTFEVNERDNIEHVARMATELVLMMTAAAVGRRSLAATGLKGAGPMESKRSTKKKNRQPLSPEAEAKRKAAAERDRVWRLDLLKRGFDPLDVRDMPRPPELKRERYRLSAQPDPLKGEARRPGRPKGTTKAEMARRRAEILKPIMDAANERKALNRRRMGMPPEEGDQEILDRIDRARADFSKNIEKFNLKRWQQGIREKP